MITKRDAEIFRVYLQTITSMDRRDFMFCWGGDFEHLWNKYVEFKQNGIAFLCCLDNGNLRLFCKYSQRENEDHLKAVMKVIGE